MPPVAPRLPVIGLTGAVGAGKSTAAAECARRGCRVLDVDRMGHETLDGPTVRDAVIALFGRDVLGDDGRLDRATIARRVFTDAAALRDLEAIVHPVVAERVRAALAEPAAPGTRATVIDCALLFESGLDGLCDHTVCVTAEPAVRHARLAATRGWSQQEILRREGAQLPADEKARRADRTLSNRDVSQGACSEGLRNEIGGMLDAFAPSPAAGGPSVRSVQQTQDAHPERTGSSASASTGADSGNSYGRSRDA